MSLPVYTIDICNSKRMPNYVLLEKNGKHYKQLNIFFDTEEQAKHFAKEKGFKLAATRYMQNTGPSYNLSRKDIENSIFEGDCLEVLKRFPNNSIDMVLCDLPYGTTHNKWDSIIDLDKLWFQYNRVVKPNGAIVLTSQGIFTAKLILSNEKFFKYKLSWEKSKPTNFLNAKKQPLRKHEDVCIFYRKQPIYNPQMNLGAPYDKGIRKDQLSGSYGNFKPQHIKSSGERYPTDVVYFKTAESEGKVWHPTQKPIELARYLVRTYTNPSDIVLDNSFGSGSFLVSAALEGRFFCGIEKNEDVHLFKKDAIDYIEVANERLNNTGQNINVKLYR